MAKRYHLGSHPSTIEFGGKFRNAHKFDDTYSILLSPNTAIPLSQFPSRTHKQQLLQWCLSGGAQSALSGRDRRSRMPIQVTSRRRATQGVEPANYDLIEKVSAGYVMNTIDLTSRLRFIAGVRFEGTNLTTSASTPSRIPFPIGLLVPMSRFFPALRSAMALRPTRTSVWPTRAGFLAPTRRISPRP